MPSKYSFKQEFLKEEHYSYLRYLISVEQRNGTSLESLAKETKVDLRSLRNFFYQYVPNEKLPTRYFLALFKRFGLTMRMQINCIHNL